MRIAVDVLLAFAVISAWLAALAFVRLRTPIERLHTVAFVNVVTGAAITLAALLSDGISDRSGKVVLLWLMTVGAGALIAFRLARALHLRGGERR